MTHFVKLLLLILWIGSVQSMASPPPPPSDYLDLMNVENLTFYRYEWTTGGPKRLQFNCVPVVGDYKCPEELTKVLCTNNDYRKFDRVNATRLNWSCRPLDFQDYFTYIGENDSEVQCEEVSRTTTERNVIRGSCSVTFTVSYKWFQLILLIILLCILLSVCVTLACVLVGYLINLIIPFIGRLIRKCSRNGYSTV